ncbi:MAG TPA: DUF5916 domain-containing protein [Longimicrobiaceae bacterium]|nr:DUF5916 domain-containing protein [Longimicrobiaceae bacterium]
MLAALLLAGAAALPPQSGGGAPALNAYRLTAAVGAPALDGRLDDAVWAAADSVGSFVQKEPEEGRPSNFPTIVRLAFDDQNVYVGIRAYDPDPGKIVAQLTRRDEGSSSDWLLVGIDSRHDLRTAYVFAVNPAGVKRDFTVTDGQDDDLGWDAIWEVAVARDERGWTAEYRIPLSALRFSPDGDVWGFEVGRTVQRAAEESFWAPLANDDSRVVARFGELRGMRGLPSPRRLELLPYTVSGLSRAPGEAADPFYARNDLRGAVGLDLKYGVTSDLTLDLTVNPDFGQVEADPSQVNLSQYETFLSEQRPFFTEGADLFRFGIGLGDGDGGNESLFYSRRIGRPPHYGMDAEYSDQPGQTTILGAAKLSGRVGAGWSVGALGAVTAQERAQGMAGGERFSRVVEPLTGYGLLRARRDLNGGDTQLGVVGTGVFRRLDGTEIEDLAGTALAAGADFSHRWADDAWLFSGYVLGSTVRGSEAAILELQQSPARYFQRPDAAHVRVDSSATALNGWSGSWQLARVKGRWQGGVLGSVRSPGFEVNDMGYMREADLVTNVAYLSYREFKPGKVFRQYGINTNLWNFRTYGRENLSTGGNLNGWGDFRNYWGMHAGVERNLPGWSNASLRGGPMIRRPGSTSGWIGFYSDGRKRVNGGVGFNWGREDETGGWRYSTSLDLGFHPSASTRVSLSPFFSRDRAGWQFVARPRDAAGERHYVFGEMDQRTLGISARFNQTFSPTLSLQLYAQPFISDGAFDGFMEATDPAAAGFGARFTPVPPETERSDWSFGDPDFNYRAMNLNAVLRWEYRLGSTLFVAWSHSREGSPDDPTGRFRPGHDFGELARYPATNVLLVKVNWWLNL